MPDDERPGRVRPSGPPLGGDREITYQDEPSWFRRHLTGLIAVVVTLVVVGVIAGAVLATRNFGDVTDSTALDTSSSAPASSAAASSSAPATTAPPAAPVISTAQGSVITVVSPSQWTLQVQKGLQLSVVITPTTIFPRGRTTADVVIGTTVTVKGELVNGVITAQEVAIERANNK